MYGILQRLFPNIDGYYKYIYFVKGWFWNRCVVLIRIHSAANDVTGLKPGQVRFQGFLGTYIGVEWENRHDYYNAFLSIDSGLSIKYRRDIHFHCEI